MVVGCVNDGRTRGGGRETNLGGDSLLTVGSDDGSSGFLSSDGVGEQVGNESRDRRRRLIESCRNLELRLVHLLDALLLLVLDNGLEVVLGPIEQRDSDVGLLERSDVVRAISSHERNVSERLERREDVLLLGGRDSRVDPRVLHKNRPGGQVGVLAEGGTGHADVVRVEEGSVDGVVGVDGDDDALVGRAPGEVCGESSLERR